MDRITRKELKTDKFAAEVGHTVAFLEEHRRQAVIVGIVILAIVIGSVATYFYLQHQHSERQVALRQALRIFDAQISSEPNPYVITYKTAEEKSEAIQSAFGELVANYPNSDEAMVARFYLGLVANEAGNREEAEKLFNEVFESADRAYASQAALSLAELYSSQGRNDEAETLLRDLVDNPSIMVSKEQATIALARVLAPTKPEEARKLLEPLRTERGAVSRAALTAIGELPDEEE